MKRLLFSTILFIGLGFAWNNARAAILYFSPLQQTVGNGSSFNLELKLDTQGQYVNTFEARVSFDSNKLDIVSATPGSVFNLSAPGSPSQNIGTVYFSAGLPTPGYNGHDAVLGTIIFRAKDIGLTTVKISAGKTLLNDGSGTNALSNVGQADINILPAPVSPPVVSSSSHPNPVNWYSKKDVQLSWSRPAGAYGFSYVLDQNPDTVPDDNIISTDATAKSYSGLADGVWYFHIKDRAQPANSLFSETAHFRIQIDTVAPASFSLNLLGQYSLNDVSRTPTITFQSSDSGSGIGKYEVYMDDKLFEANAVSPYNFSSLNPGPHIFKVIAYDRAGNQSEAVLPVIITSAVPFLPKNITLPVLFIVALNFIILALIIILIWVLYRRSKPYYSPEFSQQASKIGKNLETQMENMRFSADTQLSRLEQQTASQPDFRRDMDKNIIKVEEDIEKIMKKLGGNRESK